MDKFSAIWLSHSSISDFKSCPRAYYLKNIYRDPRNNHKISLVTPALSLGSAVHEVLESLSVLPTSDRFKISLIDRFQKVWEKYEGISGGFESKEVENKYKQRGEEMLRKVMTYPGILKEKAVKIKMDLPQYWLSEADNLMLCGKLDWLSYNEADDTVKIIDFKTGLTEEAGDSLQLPIYYLLAHNCQPREVTGVYYWYIARDELPIKKDFGDIETSKQNLIKIGKEIKLARALDRFKCKEGDGGCKHCKPYEKILKNQATFVMTDSYKRDIYITSSNTSDMPTSEIL